MRHINLTVFRLMLPKDPDGTHLEIAARARAAGLPFKDSDVERVVKMCQGTDDIPALGYTIESPDTDDLERIAKRIGACAELVRAGDGSVPNLSFGGALTDRDKLESMRDLFRACSDAIDSLLEATP